MGLTDNEKIAVEKGYELLREVEGVKYWKHPDGGEANFIPDFLAPPRVQVEKMTYNGEWVECPHCHKKPFLMVTVLWTVVYICPDCLYHEEPWERGD